MERKTYAWKGVVSSKKYIIISVIVFLSMGLISSWYYFSYIPKMKHEEELAQKRKKLEADKAAVSDFYHKGLLGGSIENFNKLLIEIYKSREALLLSGYEPRAMQCTPDNCKLSFKLMDGYIFNVQRLNFFNKDYDSSFSEKELNYQGLKSGLDSNAVLEAYKKGRPIDLPDCNSLLNYIYSFNSVYADEKEHELIKVTAPPDNSVIDKEKALDGNIKYYGLLIGKWTVSSKHLLYAHTFIARQSYKNSFIINKIESSKDTGKISGAIVCKKGK